MTSRWTVRVIGILMIVGFLLLLAHLQKRLVEIRNARKPAATSTR